MTLFKYDSSNQDPFAGIDALLEQFGRGFRNTFSESTGVRQIPVNLYSTDDSYEVRAELPGVQKSDVSVEIENAVLEIKAKRQFASEDRKSEISLERRITVGDDVNTDKVKARLEDGILSIHLPKREAHKPKAIKVS
ncbi:MAG: Hsp20/alpha crystallin family protein [Puniceicoccales bacterium]